MKRIISLVLIMSFMNTSLLFANDYYNKARRLYDTVEYNEALEALEDATSREENDKKTLIEIYYLKAKIYAILGKEKDAKKQFVKLLFLDNEYKISEDESPKIVKFFKETKKKFIESLTVKLNTPEIIFEAVRNVKYQKRVKIKAIISSMNESRNAKIYYRRIGSSKYLQSDIYQSEGDNFEGNIPLPLNIDRDFALEYYIGVVDFSGKMIAHYPSAEEPLILSVTLSKKQDKKNSPEISDNSSILNEWWFWTVVGVVVIGAGAGTYFAVSK